MSVAVVTGSLGLVGSAVCVELSDAGLDVVGIDNDQRAVYFGPEASTADSLAFLHRRLGDSYRHHSIDIRDPTGVESVFSNYGDDVVAVVHAAAQPSHDWSARAPVDDFEINALATLQLLETTRRLSPQAVFVFLSTNKVYGDAVNNLEYIDLDRRFDLASGHELHAGVREDFPIDHTMHSPFGVAKLAADVAVQEYGRYFGLKTVCFRAGTITGRRHSAVPLHGFLAYLGATARKRETYTVIGFGGKQVRDVIHGDDVARAIAAVVARPPAGEATVYNLGGGRGQSCSVLEAIDLFSAHMKHPVPTEMVEPNRRGDHKWWITDTAKFESDYPSWSRQHSLDDMVAELCDSP